MWTTLRTIDPPEARTRTWYEGAGNGSQGRRVRADIRGSLRMHVDRGAVEGAKWGDPEGGRLREDGIVAVLDDRVGRETVGGKGVLFFATRRCGLRYSSRFASPKNDGSVGVGRAGAQSEKSAKVAYRVQACTE